MARRDEISSTEKLLDVIRGDEASAAAGGSAAVRTGSFSKKISVGVDIGYSDIKLTKVRNVSDKQREIVDYVNLPFAPDMDRNNPRFASFLAKALSGFCGSARTVELWSTISAAQVDVRYLKIPIVPRKQLFNAVFWTYKKEAPFNEKDSIFDFDVLGDTVEEGVKKTEVLAYVVPRKEVDDLEELFERAGYPLTGITIVPFAFQNLFRVGWIQAAGNVCNIFIGRNWSRIDIFSNNNLMLSRGVKAGLNSMLESIRSGLSSGRDDFTFDGQPTLESAPQAGVSPAVAEEAEQLLSALMESGDTGVVRADVRAREEEVFELMRPALDRLIRQVERTFEHLAANYGGRTVSRIYVSGRPVSFKRLLDYFRQQFNVPVEQVDPFAKQASLGAVLAGHIAKPPSPSERSNLAPTVGLALSADGLTPNFLVSFRNREETARVNRTKRFMFGALVAVMVVLGGVHLWQSLVNGQKQAEVDRLKQELGQYNPLLDQNYMLQFAARIQRNRQSIEEYGERYLHVAAVAELSRVTPAHIRLLDVTSTQGQPETEDDKAAKPPKTGNQGQEKISPRNLTIEGLVEGEPAELESRMAEYLLLLGGSPLFGQPNETEKSVVPYGGREALKFTARLELK